MADFDLGQVHLGSGADIDSFLSTKSEGEAAYTANSILQSIGVPQGQPFYLETVQGQPATGIDALFAQPARQARSRRVVASLGDLSNFLRLSAETLIHRSEKDLWALKKEADGKFYIERLFDDNGEPLKG